MKKKKRILLVVETSRGHGRRILEGIAAFVREQTDWQIFFEDRSVLQKASKWFSTWQGDGIIARSADYQTGVILREKGIPLVELLSNSGFDLDVFENYDHLAELAINHFWERGFRNFAFFRADQTDWSQHRGDAFANYLLQKGNVPCHFCPLPSRKIKDHFLDDLICSTDTVLGEWLLSLPKPVAILAAIDIHAFYILEACQNVGITVPEEAAILGCGNDELVCSLLSPQLSSIDLNSRVFGYTAAQLLEKKMNNPKKLFSPIIVNPSHVVVRQSTDIIAINDPDVAQALRFIRNHFMEPIDIAEIADSATLTLRTLQRRFHDWLGRSPEAELTRVRLEHAQSLLRDTNLPVTSIGHRVGFSPPQYFMRVFRRELGMTPQQYRQKNQIITQTVPYCPTFIETNQND
ncbi:MAG: DNA-binding transcriptional regulator [Planctomycetaceae bacterium]|jgi:LacI family transcriptional regulator|nr:DNA-binding transcriptional regulator [Planctomycetaceae bacterium]